MKLKYFAKKINELAERYPDLAVVYSSDDEGNSFDEVYYDPSLGFFDRGDFVTGADLKEYLYKINACCIN